MPSGLMYDIEAMTSETLFLLYKLVILHTVAKWKMLTIKIVLFLGVSPRVSNTSNNSAPCSCSNDNVDAERSNYFEPKIGNPKPLFRHPRKKYFF